MVAAAAPSFVERNIVPLSFTASTMVLLTVRPLSFLAGVMGGMALHHYQWIPLKQEPILSAILAIVGAAAALVSYSAGGLAIHSIVLVCSASVGMTLYQIVKT